MKWIWINIVSFIFLTACTNRKQTEWEKYAANEVRAHLNKKFLYPDSAFTLFSSEDLDSFKKNDLKIATCIDLDCSICVGRFYYWRQFMHTVDSLYGNTIPILLYVHSEVKSPKELTEIVNKQWQGLWAYDYKYEFQDKNGLHDERFQVVVLNQENIIKLVGNPFLNKEMEKLLFKYIQSKQ